MGTMGYGGWQYYGGPQPWAGGVQSFADNFMKAYALFKGLNLKEAEEARQAELSGKQAKLTEEQTKKLQDEAMRSEALRKELKDKLAPRVIEPTPVGMMPVPTTTPQAPGLPAIASGSPADALMGPSIGQERFGLMPGQPPGGPVQAPPQGPQAGPLERNVVRPNPTPDEIAQIVMKHGSAPEIIEMAKSQYAARSKEAALEAALEKQQLVNKGYWDVAQAKLEGRLAEIDRKGGYGAYGGGGGDKTDKLAATILQGRADGVQKEINGLQKSYDEAMPKDKKAILSQIEEKRGELGRLNTQIDSFLGVVNPKAKPTKDASTPKADFKPDVFLGHAKDAVAKGAPKSEVEKRLIAQGYTKEQIDKDPYFKGWLR